MGIRKRETFDTVGSVALQKRWLLLLQNTKRQGLQRLRDFVEQKQTQGWKWEDIAEWAIYSTSTTAGDADPFENTGK